MLAHAVATSLDQLEQRPARVLLVFLAAALFALVNGRFEIGHSYEDWIDQEDPAWLDYRHLVDRFGDADTVLAAFPRALLRAETIAAYYALIDELRARPGVLGLLEPAELLLGADAETPPLGANLEDLRSRLANAPPDWRNVLVSRDVEWLSPLLLLDPAQRETHAATIDALVNGLQDLGAAPRLAGTAVFSAALQRAIASDLARVVTLLCVVSGALLIFFFRDLAMCAAVFAGIALSVLYSLALCGWLGLRVNLLTLLLVPLVFCVSLTTAIHLFARRSGGVWRLRAAWPPVVRPLAISTSTTALGCVAFSSAPQEIVARMGLAMPCAVLFSFLTSMYFVPALLATTRRLTRVPVVHVARAVPPPRWRRPVSVALGLLALAAVTSLPQLRREPDAFRFFPPDASLARDYRDIEARFSGLLVAELVVSSPRGRIDTPAARTAIEAFLARLREIPEATNVVSGYDLLAVSNAAAESPLGSAFFAAARDATRISLRLRNVAPARPWATVAADIRARTAALKAAGYSVTLTGVIPLILEAQDRLLHVQGLTLLAGLGVACVLLWPFFRTPSLLALAALASFLPLLLTAGAMAWCDIPINAVNLFVGSVILGLVVDDAIYLLHAYRDTGDIESALAEVGSALGITSLSVGLAFATLAACELVPIRQFGLLSAVAVASAWLCDTCLVPALVTWRGARR